MKFLFSIVFVSLLSNLAYGTSANQGAPNSYDARERLEAENRAQARSASDRQKVAEVARDTAQFKADSLQFAQNHGGLVRDDGCRVVDFYCDTGLGTCGGSFSGEKLVTFQSLDRGAAYGIHSCRISFSDNLACEIIPRFDHNRIVGGSADCIDAQLRRINFTY